jgi:hypothetical protein
LAEWRDWPEELGVEDDVGVRGDGLIGLDAPSGAQSRTLKPLSGDATWRLDSLPCVRKSVRE